MDCLKIIFTRLLIRVQLLKIQVVEMNKNFIKIFIVWVFLCGDKVYSSGETVIEVTLPNTENSCTAEQKVIQSSKIDRLANDYTGYKLCSIKLSSSEFHQKFSHCYLIGQHFEAFPDKVPEFTCEIDQMVFDETEFVVFVGSGVVKSGYCKFACLTAN